MATSLLLIVHFSLRHGTEVFAFDYMGRFSWKNSQVIVAIYNRCACVVNGHDLKSSRDC